MSKETVELVLALQPPPEMDLAAAFRDEDAWAALAARMQPFLAPGFRCIPRGFPGNDGVVAEGTDGLRAVFREWLDPWESYRTEVEDAIDLGGDRVLVLVHDFGRRSHQTREIALASGAIWTARDGKVTQIEVCAGRALALELAGVEQ